jgi:hypothetical protein
LILLDIVIALDFGSVVAGYADIFGDGDDKTCVCIAYGSLYVGYFAE